MLSAPPHVQVIFLLFLCLTLFLYKYHFILKHCSPFRSEMFGCKVRSRFRVEPHDLPEIMHFFTTFMGMMIYDLFTKQFCCWCLYWNFLLIYKIKWEKTGWLIFLKEISFKEQCMVENIQFYTKYKNRNSQCDSIRLWIAMVMGHSNSETLDSTPLCFWPLGVIKGAG